MINHCCILARFSVCFMKRTLVVRTGVLVLIIFSQIVLHVAVMVVLVVVVVLLSMLIKTFNLLSLSSTFIVILVYIYNNHACWLTEWGTLSVRAAGVLYACKGAPAHTLSVPPGSSKFQLGHFTKCKQFLACTNMAESRLENSAQVSSC